MPLWIFQNQYAMKVIADLRIICPDPGLTIDSTGKISYSQTPQGTGVGCDTVALLQNKGTVAIRGEATNWSSSPQPNQTLAKMAGVAIPNVYPGTQVVDVVYDATDCNGNGFVTIDPKGVLIDLPSHVLLYHELAHALHMFMNFYDPSNREALAIASENAYRASRGLPARGGWEGGCRGLFTGPTGPVTPGPATPPAKTVAPAVCGPLLMSFPQAIGTSHTLPRTALTQGTYHINVNNQSADTFTQIVVFYKRVGKAGVVFLKAEQVQPGQVVGFMCGLCTDLESYVVGFFIDDELVAQLPATGNMTPALASQLNPTDTDPCIDSWAIS